MMAVLPDMHEMAKKIAHEAIELIRIDVDGKSMTLNEFGAMVRQNYAEIVHCRMCKHWDNSTEGRYVGGWCFCEKLQFSTAPDWYCADGEMMSNAKAD